MRIVFIALATFLLGFAAGRFFGTSESGAPSPSAAAKLSLLALSETEYQEYLRLNDSPEKLKKADELLGKVMQLILADIGIVSRTHSIGAVTEGPSPPSPPRLAAAPVKPALTPVGPEARPWMEIEQKVMNGNSEPEILDALKSADIQNVFHELQTSQPLSNDQLGLVNGKYAGEIRFYDGGPSWQVEWLVEADTKDGGLAGKMDVKLSKSGKVFSHSSSNGDLKDFSAASGKSQAIFVKANGDAGYMQLWGINSLQRLAGVYFVKESIDHYRSIGTVSLERSR